MPYLQVPELGWPRLAQLSLSIWLSLAVAAGAAEDLQAGCHLAQTALLTLAAEAEGVAGIQLAVVVAAAVLVGLEPAREYL